MGRLTEVIKDPYTGEPLKFTTKTASGPCDEGLLGSDVYKFSVQNPEKYGWENRLFYYDRGHFDSFPTAEHGNRLSETHLDRVWMAFKEAASHVPAHLTEEDFKDYLRARFNADTIYRRVRGFD